LLQTAERVWRKRDLPTVRSYSLAVLDKRNRGAFKGIFCNYKRKEKMGFSGLRAVGPTIYWCYRSRVEQRGKGASNRERGDEFRELLLYFLLLKIERRRKYLRKERRLYFKKAPEFSAEK
jgi:hypothetical protein